MPDNGIYIGYKNKITKDAKSSVEKFFNEIFGDCRTAFGSLDNQEVIRVIPSKKTTISDSMLNKISTTLESFNLKSPSITVF
jgi:hypothetical protein